MIFCDFSNSNILYVMRDMPNIRKRSGAHRLCSFFYLALDDVFSASEGIIDYVTELAEYSMMIIGLTVVTLLCIAVIVGRLLAPFWIHLAFF